MMAGVFVCFTDCFCLQQSEQSLAPSKCSTNEWILRKWFYGPELKLREAVEKIFWHQAFSPPPKTFLSWSYPKKLHGPKLGVPGIRYDPSATVEDAVFGYHPDWLCWGLFRGVGFWGPSHPWFDPAKLLIKGEFPWPSLGPAPYKVGWSFVGLCQAPQPWLGECLSFFQLM